MEIISIVTLPIIFILFKNDPGINHLIEERSNKGYFHEVKTIGSDHECIYLKNYELCYDDDVPCVYGDLYIYLNLASGGFRLNFQTQNSAMFDNPKYFLGENYMTIYKSDHGNTLSTDRYDYYLKYYNLSDNEEIRITIKKKIDGYIIGIKSFKT